MGLMRNIIIAEYTTAWQEMFVTESLCLNNALESVLISIHHIGSTSIPGLAAKPTIDMLAVVQSLNELDTLNHVMSDLGYVAKGELGIVGRRFFAKGSDDHRTHHVHAYEEGHPEIESHLDFRDYLRSHPDQVSCYAELKSKLSEQHRNDVEAYIEGKSSFIEETIWNARQWRQLLDNDT
ncbi:dephospho-CoA kinase/protein folding accessory domain-containing protein [Gimesia aquarii]|uniref:Dephospho-CoA kinase/protein folding accessory domain-containing protein n=2 Tax=Gimesia aquarii TaxID=2527964 RepID=A0A517VSQ7_9PLAN|nr:dephospho-CoA kinase/protein folding accessory domain-containing protein [Gimesia aquarii]